MKTFLPLLTKVALTLVITGLSGCKSVDIRGQFIADSAVAQINSNKFSKEEVEELIGSPTYIPEYTKDTWYYIQRSENKKAWFHPQTQQQRIIKIDFAQDIAQKAEILNNLQNENINIDSTITQSRGTEQNSVQKFVKNIGRFNKTTDGSKKKKK